MKESFLAGVLLVGLLFGSAWVTAEAPAVPEQLQTEQETPVLDAAMTLSVRRGEQTLEMTMAEFLPGVVRGEMPASFEQEALAAQAVAERTYVCRYLQAGRKAQHPEADICTDPACCSAWTSPEDAAAKWGEKAQEYEAKIQQAVQSTDGQILLYDGQPILAAFHSSSDGVTANSGDVWVQDLPYLTSVQSPEGESSVPNYYSVKTVPAAEFRETVLAAYPQAQLEGAATGWIGALVQNDSGRVEQITFGGIPLKGTEVRSLFGLRSASFSVESTDSEVTFRVTGYGHGVGMSQYGANELARQGKTWQEILQWYYTGVTISSIQSGSDVV